MKILLYLYYFFRSAILRGLFNTLRLLRAEVSYEKALGIKTSMIKKSDSEDFYHYQGASYLVLLRIFSEVRKYTASLEFTDIGCGKGRAVFVAEYCGYNKLTGIELDKELVTLAQENVQLYRLKRPESAIHFTEANALEYTYQPGPVLYFLFNPFSEAVLEKVLDKIITSGSGGNWFIYMNPQYPQPFEKRSITCVKKIRTRFYNEAFIYKQEARGRV